MNRRVPEARNPRGDFYMCINAKKERAEEIERRYRQGETLQEIGLSLDLTRERVRQILRDLGVDPMAGGAAIRRFLHVDKKIEQVRKCESRREQHARKFWGVSAADCVAIKQMYGYRPFRSYMQQRRNAKVRGIEWGMSFREWWWFWQDSGVWGNRGRGNAYCMARYGDSGPYSIGNVYVCTNATNVQDYHRLAKRSQDTQKHLCQELEIEHV